MCTLDFADMFCYVINKFNGSMTYINTSLINGL